MLLLLIEKHIRVLTIFIYYYLIEVRVDISYRYMCGIPHTRSYLYTNYLQICMCVLPMYANTANRTEKVIIYR